MKNSDEVDFSSYDFDIVGLIKTHAARHWIHQDDVSKMLAELDTAAQKVGVEPDSLYMILLDSISGNFVGTKEDIIHQIKVAIDNSNNFKCFAV